MLTMDATTFLLVFLSVGSSAAFELVSPSETLQNPTVGQELRLSCQADGFYEYCWWRHREEAGQLNKINIRKVESKQRIERVLCCYLLNAQKGNQGLIGQCGTLTPSQIWKRYLEMFPRISPDCLMCP